MAKGALLSPHLAMWLPNIVLGAAGLALLFWRARSAERRITIPLPLSGPDLGPLGCCAGAACFQPRSAPHRG